MFKFPEDWSGLPIHVRPGITRRIDSVSTKIAPENVIHAPVWVPQTANLVGGKLIFHTGEPRVIPTMLLSLRSVIIAGLTLEVCFFLWIFLFVSLPAHLPFPSPLRPFSLLFLRRGSKSVVPLARFLCLCPGVTRFSCYRTLPHMIGVCIAWVTVR